MQESQSQDLMESLLKIKQKQAEMLKQFSLERDVLQGSFVSNVQFRGQYRSSGLEFSNNHSFQSSLELSKSEGNHPKFASTYAAYKTASTGPEDILENNYKKIQELLLKQRKLYEQNHTLQQENESIMEDYRQLKKMFYELKETTKNNLHLINYILNQVSYESIKDMLLEVPNAEIVSKTRKSWNKFKIDFPKLFVETGNNQEFVKQCEDFITRINGLLDQDFKINSIKEKEEEIYQLKKHIENLVNKQTQINKQKAQLNEIQAKKSLGLEKENLRLSQKIKSLEISLLQSEKQFLNKLKNLQEEVIVSRKLLQQLKIQVNTRQESISELKTKKNMLKQQLKANNERKNQFEKELETLNTKMKQKQQLLISHIEINKKQNTLIQKLGRDNQEFQNIIKGTHFSKAQNTSKLYLENQGLRQQIINLRQQFDRYRENSQRQISSLLAHLRQLKNQHMMLIQSQQSARLNEMKYRQIVASRSAQLRMSVSTQHLWSIKQIEYENIINSLACLRQLK